MLRQLANRPTGASVSQREGQRHIIYELNLLLVAEEKTSVCLPNPKIKDADKILSTSDLQEAVDPLRPKESRLGHLPTAGLSPAR